MKFTQTFVGKSLLFAMIALVATSCTKDADLLSEYVINEELEINNVAILENDYFLRAQDQSEIILNVLDNDNFAENTTVAIVSTTEGQNGSIIINQNNTLTYTPKEAVVLVEEEVTVVVEEPKVTTPTPTTTTPKQPETKPKVTTTPAPKDTSNDNFTYTAEVVDNDTGETTTQEATVVIETSTQTQVETALPRINMGALKAFPSAEGFGKNTTGGRGGLIYHVTNLTDNGEGSLRYGVESIKETRTIVFDVSGSINIKTPIKIRKGYGNLTIAGQTAPQNGITIKGAAIWIHEGNVIMRYIKIRPGKNAYNPSGLPSSHENYEPDDGIRIQAYSGASFENIILDHVTVTWAHDGLIDVGSAPSPTFVRNVSIQNCLLGENVGKKYGVLINNSYNISFHKNIIAFTSDRNIAIASPEGKGVEMINNLIYTTDRAAWYVEGTVNDFRGNKFISGVRNREYQTFKMEKNHFGGDVSKSSIYLDNNTDDGANADSDYNYRAIPYISSQPNYNTGVKVLKENKVEALLVSSSGDNLNYDTSDIRIMNHIKNRTGQFIDNESSVGGYPVINSKSRDNSFDNDRDGMADKWEREYYGNLSKTAQDDENGDGYTNIEEYLFQLVK